MITHSVTDLVTANPVTRVAGWARAGSPAAKLQASITDHVIAM